MPTLASASLSGFALGASLIVAIGAQNAFVLRQGIRREQVAVVVAVCVACDWALISAGAMGFGSLIARFPIVTAIAAWGGAAFLAVHGALSLKSAFSSEALADDAADVRPALTARAALVATLAVSLLNPHVYLDTVVLLGSVAAQRPAAQRAAFALGAGLASLAWFSALGFGARGLAPLFRRPAAWRALDLIVAVIMWSIAATLVIGQLR